MSDEYAPQPSPGDGSEGSRASRRMSEVRVRMTEIVMPNDTNPHGSISGGRVMQLIDIAAAVAALRHCRRSVVTASFDDVSFLAPVPLGHIILLDAQLTLAGRTSVEVKVMVRSENPLTGERCDTTTAYVTFVALDDEGKPVQVPELIAETEDEKAMMERARLRRELRLAQIAQG